MNKRYANYLKVRKQIESIKKKTSSKAKRKLGILQGKVTIIFHDDFKMTDEEFISL
ncbi:MAG: hypothetical protein V5804_06590 [Mucilaginibacter sp.]|uniref:hypothetical protein n=1 Tax=Mucilaginibacter sp. TaxID=1882438 RepID=UPI0034E49A9D